MKRVAMKILVSVRSVQEALWVAEGGADFIDLKEPGQGALGGLPVATIAAIVAALKQQCSSLPVSATIGDVPMHELARIMDRVQAVGACGVDYVKVGIERSPRAREVLDALAHSGLAIVPVFIADHGLDVADVAHACSLGFPGVMADTADKRAGSLFDAMPMDDLRRFVSCVKASGAMVGLAGALRTAHRSPLIELAPDFAGFRTAVCAGDRSGTIEPQRLRELVETMHGKPPADAPRKPDTVPA